MANRPLVLKHWQPSSPLTQEDVFKVPVWIRLFNVPFEYWTSKGLSYIASAVGCPLHADHITLTRKRLSYARVCVELDARDELVRDFDFQCSNGMWTKVAVDFEWLPIKCSKYGVFGHSLSSCPKDVSKVVDNSSSKVWVLKATVPSHDVPLPTKEDNEEWITVSRKKKGKDVATTTPIVSLPCVAPSNHIQTVVSGEGTSQDMAIVSFDKKEEGECTPITTRPNDVIAADMLKGAFVEISKVDGALYESGGDCVSPVSYDDSLAAKARDSLEKKRSSPSGKQRKNSGGKKGRKHHSSRGSRWK